MISRAHGIKGEVKVQLITDEPKRRLGTSGRRYGRFAGCTAWISYSWQQQQQAARKLLAVALAADGCIFHISVAMCAPLQTAAALSLLWQATALRTQHLTKHDCTAAEQLRVIELDFLLAGCQAAHDACTFTAGCRLWLQAGTGKASAAAGSSSQVLQRVVVQSGRVARPASKDRRAEWAVKFKEVPGRDEVRPGLAPQATTPAC